MNITNLFQIIDYDLSKIQIYPCDIDGLKDDHKSFVIDSAIVGVFNKYTSEVIYVWYDNYKYHTGEFEDEDTDSKSLTSTEMLDKLNERFKNGKDEYFPIDGLTLEELAAIDNHAAELNISRNDMFTKIIINSAKKILLKEQK